MEVFFSTNVSPGGRTYKNIWEKNEILSYQYMVLLNLKSTERIVVSNELHIPQSTIGNWIKTKQKIFKKCKVRNLKPSEYRPYETVMRRQANINRLEAIKKAEERDS